MKVLSGMALWSTVRLRVHVKLLRSQDGNLANGSGLYSIEITHDGYDECMSLIAATSSRERHVLLVEDDPSEVQLVHDAIGPRNIRTHVVNSVPRAICFLERLGEFADVAAPNLVLLDMHLPFLPGTALLAERKRRNLWTDIPIVVFSSSDLLRDECLMLGAMDYVRKPGAWSAWQWTIDDLVERYLQ